MHPTSLKVVVIHASPLTQSVEFSDVDTGSDSWTMRGLEIRLNGRMLRLMHALFTSSLLQTEQHSRLSDSRLQSLLAQVGGLTLNYVVSCDRAVVNE